MHVLYYLLYVLIKVINVFYSRLTNHVSSALPMSGCVAAVLLFIAMSRFVGNVILFIYIHYIHIF